MSEQPSNLQTTYAVIKPGLLVDSLPVTDTVYAELDAHYDRFAGHTLVASFRFEEDWPTWEIHPHGDEIVVLMAGRADVVLRTAEGDERQDLSRPGDFVVVPKGTWHTARINQATDMLFITPGEGTENRQTPDQVV